jgi:phage major head subunit gpT-like protein
MIFNTAILKKGIDARFHQQQTAMLQRGHLAAMAGLYTNVPSNGAYEDYSWLGDLPGVREWVGDKSLGSIKDYDYQIKNKDWYDGFSIDRNELEDQQIAAINPRIDMLAQSVANWPHELIVSLIVSGTSGKAYDGQPFFSNRSANDNLFTGGGSTLANLKTDIQEARAAMMRFKSDSGRVMGLVMDTILCPPELEATMLEAVNASTIQSTDNTVTFNAVSRFSLNVVPMPELADSNDWYGFATSAPLRPFLFQNRSGVRTVLDDTQVKRNRKLDYSAEMRGNAGYGFYQMGVKVTNT